MSEDIHDLSWGIPLAPREENKRVLRVIIGAAVVAFSVVVAQLLLA